MGEVSCPQCGNTNLDVDAQNNVVYCKNCGFAVRVDPQTGNVTPISQGGAPASAPMASSPQGMPMHKVIFGMEPFVFLAISLLLVFLAALIFNFQGTTTIVLISLVLLAWWFGKR
jgi:hypothetical protein